MKYMLLIHDDEKVWKELSDGDRNNMYAEYGKFTEHLKSSGHYVAGSQLQPIATATSVKVRHGKRVVTDGPFAETREQLAGYYLIDVPHLDDAIAAAAKIPSARIGTIEVRPVVDMRPPA